MYAGNRLFRRLKPEMILNKISFWEYMAPYRKITSSCIKKLIPEKKFIIGYTGTFGLANSLDILFEAASIVQKQNDDIFWLFTPYSGKIPKSRFLVESGPYFEFICFNFMLFILIL
jgi:hypothetical protein